MVVAETTNFPVALKACFIQVRRTVFNSLILKSRATAKTKAVVISSGEARSKAQLRMRGLKSATDTAMVRSLIAVGFLNMVLDICSIADARSGAPGVGVHCKIVQNRFMLAVEEPLLTRALLYVDRSKGCWVPLSSRLLVIANGCSVWI